MRLHEMFRMEKQKSILKIDRITVISRNESKEVSTHTLSTVICLTLMKRFLFATCVCVYLACCSSGGSGRGCSVRTPPGSCWSWGWMAFADEATSPHHPGNTQEVMSSNILAVHTAHCQIFPTFHTLPTHNNGLQKPRLHDLLLTTAINHIANLGNLPVTSQAPAQKHNQ